MSDMIMRGKYDAKVVTDFGFVPKRDDLISRSAAIEYLMTNMGWRDEDGYEVDDADEKRAIITDLVNGIPAVDAKPVKMDEPYIRTQPIKFEYACPVCETMLVEHWTDCPCCGNRLEWSDAKN